MLHGGGRTEKLYRALIAGSAPRYIVFPSRFRGAVILYYMTKNTMLHSIKISLKLIEY